MKKVWLIYENSATECAFLVWVASSKKKADVVFADLTDHGVKAGTWFTMIEWVVDKGMLFDITPERDGDGA